MFDFEIKEEVVGFPGTNTASITYSFTNIPFITATSLDFNVNVWVESVTTTGCTIRTSAPINGSVHVHMIGKK